MAETLEKNPSPKKIPPAKRTPTPSLKNIGKTLTEELGQIVDHLGSDHPDLLTALMKYITELDWRHPGWRPTLDRAQARLIGGK